ncbi:MAG: membrane protein insertion efficiency factor YidD [Actinomycetales bacterium]
MSQRHDPSRRGHPGRRHRPRRDTWLRRRGRDLVDCGDAVECLDCVPGCNLAVLMLMPRLLLTVLVGACRASAVDPYVHPHGAGAALAARLVRSYQVNVSARRARPVCNLSPSCSRYGLSVLGEHGVWTSTRLIWRRLRECRAAGRRARAA